MQKIIWSICLLLVLTNVQAQTPNLVYDANAQVRNVGSFSGVSVGSGIKLYLSQGTTQAVAVSAEDAAYTDKIITEVKDGVLKIRVESKMWNNWNWGNKKLKAYVTVTNINFLGASGGSIAEVADQINVNDIRVDASGGSIIKGKFTGNNMQIDLSGGSIARLDGSLEKLNVSASGGSIFKDYSLVVNYLSVDASGGSIINASISKELKASASGGSIINYKGTGVITSVDASGGSIIKKKD